MSDRDRQRESPPLDAYSRVTDPERFRPLHARGLALVDRLAADYDVERTEAFALLPGMRPSEHALAPVTLTPLACEGAPIAIAFTTFPGLLVRYGNWLADSFPSCGCDACAETAAAEGTRLERLLADVVAGLFREELTIPWFGQAKLRWALGDMIRVGHRAEGVGVLPRAKARALHHGGPWRVQWHPWSPRGPAGGAPAV
jgi:hypothetical protein